MLKHLRWNFARIQKLPLSVHFFSN